MNKELLDALFVKLEQDFPDSSTTLTVENFVDWLVKYQRETEVASCADGKHCFIGARCFHCGVSVTGRLPSQPELQHLPSAPFKYADFLEFGQPLVPLTDTEIEVAKQRAKELLQQYRDTFPAMGAPWEASLRNFPCVAVDLASGVDYSFEQHPIQANHASVDDKGNVSVSGIRRGVFSSKGPSQNLPKWEPAQDKTPRQHSGIRVLNKEQARRECCRHIWQYTPHASTVFDFCVMCYTKREHLMGFWGMTEFCLNEAVERFRLTCVHQFEDDGVHTSPICFLCGAPQR